MNEIEFEGFGYRLIPSRFPSVEVYQGLVANDCFPDLYDLEAETNPRLQSKDRILASYGGEGSPQLQNWNHAPFRYPNPEGSLFFPSTQPAIELSDDPQTALARAVMRREIFLGRTNELPIGIDMRMLKTAAKGRFADLRDLPMDLDTSARRAAAANVAEDLAGIAFLAPERPYGLCLAITDAAALGVSIQTVHYRFEWNGVRIAKLYAFTESGEEWDPVQLSGNERLVAA